MEQLAKKVRKKGRERRKKSKERGRCNQYNFAYEGLRNVSFWESFTHVLNEIHLMGIFIKKGFKKPFIILRTNYVCKLFSFLILVTGANQNHNADIRNDCKDLYH